MLQMCFRYMFPSLVIFKGFISSLFYFLYISFHGFLHILFSILFQATAYFLEKETVSDYLDNLDAIICLIGKFMIILVGMKYIQIIYQRIFFPHYKQKRPNHSALNNPIFKSP